MISALVDYLNNSFFITHYCGFNIWSPLLLIELLTVSLQFQSFYSYGHHKIPVFLLADKGLRLIHPLLVLILHQLPPILRKASQNLSANKSMIISLKRNRIENLCYKNGGSGLGDFLGITLNDMSIFPQIVLLLSTAQYPADK